jgi:hypothetical protein
MSVSQATQRMQHEKFEKSLVDGIRNDDTITFHGRLWQSVTHLPHNIEHPSYWCEGN